MVSELDRLIEDYHSLDHDYDNKKNLEICKKILKIDPSLIEFKESLGESYYNNKEYDKSIEIFNECIKEGNNKAGYYVMLALSYAKLGNRKKAFELIDQIKSEELKLQALQNLHMDLGEYDKAIEYGDRTLELNPENKYVLRHMINIYHELGDDERSLFYLHEYANIDPEMKGVEIVWLHIFQRHDEMIEIFEEYKDTGALNNDLEDPFFLYVIGYSYNMQNKHYEALKYLICSDRLMPELRKKRLIAKNYMDTYEFKNANKYLTQALEIDPLDYNCLLMITETSYYLEDYYKAIGYANTLLKNYDEADTIFRILGAIYFDLGDIKTGWKCISMHDSPEGYGEDYILEICRSLSRSNQSERALNIFHILEEKIPEFPFTYLERAKHYKRIGEMDLAKKDFKKYNELWFDEDSSFEDL